MKSRFLADALEVPRQLLDRVDGSDALDLNRDEFVLVVAAHQVHRPDVGRPLAPDEPQTLRGRVGEQLLKLAFDALLLERRGLAHVMRHVREHFGDPNLDAILAALLAHHEEAGLLLDHGGRRHPVLRLVAPGVGMHHHRPVRLQHQQPKRLREDRGEAAGVANFAASDDEAHVGPT